MTKSREGQRDLVADITAQHKDKGLARHKSRARFRVERVVIRLNWFMRLKVFLAGGVITFSAARAPQKVSGVEILELRVISNRSLRKLERLREEEEARKRPRELVEESKRLAAADKAAQANEAMKALKEMM
jgi:galactokinase